MGYFVVGSRPPLPECMRLVDQAEIRGIQVRSGQASVFPIDQRYDPLTTAAGGADGDWPLEADPAQLYQPPGTAGPGLKKGAEK